MLPLRLRDMKREPAPEQLRRAQALARPLVPDGQEELLESHALRPGEAAFFFTLGRRASMPSIPRALQTSSFHRSHSTRWTKDTTCPQSATLASRSYCGRCPPGLAGVARTMHWSEGWPAGTPYPASRLASARSRRTKPSISPNSSFSISHTIRRSRPMLWVLLARRSCTTMAFHRRAEGKSDSSRQSQFLAQESTHRLHRLERRPRIVSGCQLAWVTKLHRVLAQVFQEVPLELEGFVEW